MAHNFDTVVQRKGTNAFKWDFLKHRFGDENLTPLWVADMDFAVPAAVTEALVARAQHPIYGYSVRPKSYFESLQKWLLKRHKWNIETSWCLHSPMVVTSLSVLVESLTGPGDKVLVQAPVYQPFYAVIQNNMRVPVIHKLIEKDGYYTMDFAALEEELKDGVRLVLLCNPHNPVGRVWTREELTQLAQLCLKYGATIVSDEIHSDLVFAPHQHVVLASLSEEIAEHVITCVSPSKTFNLAGLGGSALVISNPELRRRCEAGLMRFGLEITNVFAVTAFEAAYKFGAEWLDDLLKYLQNNLASIEYYLRPLHPQVRYLAPEGTYLAWLDFSYLGLESEVLYQKLAEEVGIAIEPGTKFGPGGEGHIRINFACPQSQLVPALERLAKWVEKQID